MVQKRKVIEKLKVYLNFSNDSGFLTSVDSTCITVGGISSVHF